MHGQDRTYEAVVLAANGSSVAAVATHADAGDGTAVHADLAGDAAEVDAEKANERRDDVGVTLTGNVSSELSSTGIESGWVGLTSWTELQHWIEPVLHWSAEATAKSAAAATKRVERANIAEDGWRVIWAGLLWCVELDCSTEG